MRKLWKRFAEAPEPRADLSKGRSRRVILLLVLVWIVAIFDLVLTLHARQIAQFQEANPLAALLIHSKSMIIAFKLTSLTLATVVFLKYRRRLLTEISCWAIVAVHVVVAVIWRAYYHGFRFD